jgi:hypothetical protein
MNPGTSSKTRPSHEGGRLHGCEVVGGGSEALQTQAETSEKYRNRAASWG